jgi:hypothetical protein
LLTQEPNAPVATPLQLTDSKFGTVKKVYIRTTQDKALSPDVQEHMLQRTPVDQTFVLDASHSPFFSKPKELADILLNL